MSIKVSFIEDNPTYRQTLSIILKLDPDLQVLHELENISSMIAAFEEEKPDVVLMDIDLPEKNGIEGLWIITETWPDIKVMILTVFEDDDKIFGAIKAGANGYLLKKDSPGKILDAIHAVHNGESAMNGMIASKLLDYFKKEGRKRTYVEKSGLTSREKEILLLLVKGFSYKEIAAELFISVETLNTHTKNVYRKLNVHSRGELAAKFGSSF